MDGASGANDIGDVGGAGGAGGGGGVGGANIKALGVGSTEELLDVGLAMSA